MANNELDATFNLIAQDDGLATAINAGLAGLQQMFSVMVKFNGELNQASKTMAQLKNAERVQTRAAPNERAIVANQKTSDTIVKATTITRDQTKTSTTAGPSAVLAGTIARREQNLPLQTGRERVQGALQLASAKELETRLNGIEREANKADTALKRLTVPVTAQTMASYEQLKVEIEDINRRLANNIQRGRFSTATGNLDQLAGKTEALRALPASNAAELAAQTAAARDVSTLNKAGIARLDAERLANERSRAKEISNLERQGIARLEAERIADEKARQAEQRAYDRELFNLNRQGIARIEADRLAEQKIRDAELARQLKVAQAAQIPARIDKANQSRQNVNDNLFGDGGASFAGRIAGSYGIFQAVNAGYAALFGKARAAGRARHPARPADQRSHVAEPRPARKIQRWPRLRADAACSPDLGGSLCRRPCHGHHQRQHPGRRHQPAS